MSMMQNSVSFLIPYSGIELVLSWAGTAQLNLTQAGSDKDWLVPIVPPNLVKKKKEMVTYHLKALPGNL